MVSQNDSIAQLVAHQLLGLFHLLLGDGKAIQFGMVKLQFILTDGSIATLLDIGQDGSYGVVELRQVESWTGHNISPLPRLRIFENLHYSIIFSMGVTKMPCAPISFSLPMISQKRFWSSTV